MRKKPDALPERERHLAMKRVSDRQGFHIRELASLTLKKASCQILMKTARSVDRPDCDI